LMKFWAKVAIPINLLILKTNSINYYFFVKNAFFIISIIFFCKGSST
jgi:hypothetical protein